MLEELSREELIGLCRQLITQVAELDQLRQANVELTDRVARLERLVSRNSKSSGMPPSKDDNPAGPRVVPRRRRRQDWYPKVGDGLGRNQLQEIGARMPAACSPPACPAAARAGPPGRSGRGAGRTRQHRRAAAVRRSRTPARCRRFVHRL
jgi:hypothetical protein